MKTAFADTAFWIALVNPRDEHHANAKRLATTYSRFVTTQWVLAEFLDGFCGEATRGGAAQFVRALERQNNLAIILVDDEGFHRGMKLFEDRPDKDWSLTDCISILIMQDRGLGEALTADHHFEQAGFVALLQQG